MNFSLPFPSVDGRTIHKEDDSGDIELTLEDLLAFVTGADHPPPLGFLTSPEITFTNQPDRILPTSSTCALVLYLSLHVKEFESFCSGLDEAIISSPGFGVV